MPKKLWQKLKYLKNEKYFWDGIKSIFHQFSRSFNEANNTIFFFFFERRESDFQLFWCGSWRNTRKSLLYARVMIVFTPNWEFFRYSEVIHGTTTFNLTEGRQRLKKNYQLFNLMFLIFLSFSLSQTISVINRSGACYFLHASN